MLSSKICLAVVFCAFSVAASAVNPGPRFDYPQDGQELDFEGDDLFQVGEVSNSEGYLWGFFQDGQMVWKNQRDEQSLSSRNYGLSAGSQGWQSFPEGEVEVWCSAYVNGEWTEATKIRIKLRSRQRGCDRQQFNRPIKLIGNQDRRLRSRRSDGHDRDASASIRHRPDIAIESGNREDRTLYRWRLGTMNVNCAGSRFFTYN